MLFKEVLYGLTLLIGAIVFVNVRSRRIRQAVLLICSYGLYISWGAWFAVVLLISTVMNFFLGQRLRRKPSGLPLSIGVLLNLALLSSFKYLPEISVTVPLSSLQRFSHLALPLGISFWTFQAMSYLFDLYRGEEIDPGFCEFALYMVFFPVAISGPICRMGEMLPQFRSEKRIAWNDVGRGMSRIATGILMMQIAKLLGQGILAGDGINSGFDHVTRWSGTDVLVPGVWVRITAILRLCRLLPYCDRRRQNPRFYLTRELRCSVPIRHPIDFLDAMAHVAVVLDSGLCILPAGRVTTRGVVAKLSPSTFDDPFWIVA